MEGITKKAMAMHAEAEQTKAQKMAADAGMPGNAAAGGRGGGSSGSGLGDAQRRGSVRDQHERDLQTALKASFTTAAVGSKKRSAED